METYWDMSLQLKHTQQPACYDRMTLHLTLSWTYIFEWYIVNYNYIKSDEFFEKTKLHWLPIHLCNIRNKCNIHNALRLSYKRLIVGKFRIRFPYIVEWNSCLTFAQTLLESYLSDRLQYTNKHKFLNDLVNCSKLGEFVLYICRWHKHFHNWIHSKRTLLKNSKANIILLSVNQLFCYL